MFGELYCSVAFSTSTVVPPPGHFCAPKETLYHSSSPPAPAPSPWQDFLCPQPSVSGRLRDTAADNARPLSAPRQRALGPCPLPRRGNAPRGGRTPYAVGGPWAVPTAPATVLHTCARGSWVWTGRAVGHVVSLCLARRLSWAASSPRPGPSPPWPTCHSTLGRCPHGRGFPLAFLGLGTRDSHGLAPSGRSGPAPPPLTVVSRGPPPSHWCWDGWGLRSCGLCVLGPAGHGQTGSSVVRVGAEAQALCSEELTKARCTSLRGCAVPPWGPPAERPGGHAAWAPYRGGLGGGH